MHDEIYCTFSGEKVEVRYNEIGRVAPDDFKCLKKLVEKGPKVQCEIVGLKECNLYHYINRDDPLKD